MNTQIVTKLKYDTRLKKRIPVSRAFEFEVAVSIVASTPFLFDTDCWNASQSTIPKRARKQALRRESLGHRIKLGAG